MMLASIATSLFSTLAAITAPYSVKNRGGFLLPPCRELDIAFCDIKSLTSWNDSENMKSLLLATAEEEAKYRGCTSSALDTFSFQSPEFYDKAKYKVIGQMNDFPKGQTRLFYVKKL
jgi:hypothetical protein